MNYTIFFRCALGIGLVVLSLYILNYHIPFSGVKEIRYNFRAPDGTVSHVYPVARVKDMARQDGRTYRAMIEDPVYFDVRTVAPYDTARIDLVYQNTTRTPLQIGMKLQSGETAFDLKPLQDERKEGQWTRGTAQFDLSRASYYNSKYTFAFSVPGLRAEQVDTGEIRLSQMVFTLERPPLRWADIKSVWKKK
jgi:hypothetical protein